MTYITLLVFHYFILFATGADKQGTLLLSSPGSISLEEVNRNAQDLSLDMRWSSSLKSSHKCSIGFKRKSGKASLEIQFMDDFPTELILFQNQFTFCEFQGRKIWTFSYGGGNNNKEVSLTSLPLSLEEAMGIVHPPRILQNQDPKITTPIEVGALVRKNRCVFYTGAGLSAGIVPTMAQLMRDLQLESILPMEKGLLTTIETALKNPDPFLKIMDHFYEACLYGSPSPGHLAIRDIVQKLNWGLLTENLDLLHQRTGVDPLCHEGKNWLKDSVKEADLKKIDYIITVGLSGDESGFLGWYKAMHPDGTIIAINLQKPSYLANDDLWVKGDLQEILPLLRDLLIGLSNLEITS